jgi:acyl-CoA dehydrogenase
MVEVSFSPELEQMQGVIREFARDRLAPQAAAAETARTISRDILATMDQIGVSSGAGDDALDPLAMVVVAEELAAGDPGVAYEVTCVAHAARTLAALGTAEQVAAVAAAVASGAAPAGSVWLYEGFGRHPHEYASTVGQGTGGVVLSGRKIGVVRPGAVDFAVVFVRSASGQGAAVLGPAQLAACAVTRDDRVAGKLGLLAAHTGDVELRDVAVPAAAWLTAGGDLAVDRVIAAIRLSTAAIAIGAGTAALRYAARYSTEREAFGQPISSYQGVVFPLSEAEIALDAARYAIWDLAARLDAADDPVRLAEQTGHAVAAANRAARAATVAGVNTLGGHGFLTDHPVERWYRAAGTLAALDHDPLLD